LLSLNGSLGDSLAHVNLYFDTRSRRQLLAPLRLGRGWTSPEQYKIGLAGRGSVIDAATRLDFMTTLVDDYLVKVDRASMLASLEVRAPFLDYRLVDFAYARLPEALRATGGDRKILLRRLARRLLPPELDIKRKQGFVIPLARWLRRDWKSFVDGVLNELDTSILDRATVHSVVAGHRSGLANTQRIFALLLFELWRREYRIAR
jgi:asparagine synthase (glutamine-hydrolysing)